MAEQINFYRIDDAYGCFSNFSKHAIILDGVEWPTAEHYFQAQKFQDESLRRLIRETVSHMEVKKLGNRRDYPLRENWEQVKDDVMRTAVRAKVMQHEEVRATLSDTGNAVLCEHTVNDSYWADGGDGSGRNMLGRILMEVREELRRE